MIIFLYGPDTFRSRRFLQKLKNKFISEIDPQAASLNLLNGSALNLKDLIEKINTSSLFVKKRLVVIENIFENKSEKIFINLLEYLKKKSGPKNDIIIFRDEFLESTKKPLKSTAKKLFNFLAKQPYSQEFSLLNRRELLSFIQKEAKTYQKELNIPTAQLLIDRSDNNLWTISNALKKLAFHTTKKTITLEDVKKLVKGSEDENIFALTDALSTKNKKLALQLLEEQYTAGLSNEYLITMLIRQFKILLQVKSAQNKKMSSQEIVSHLKLHPFVVKKSLSQTKNFSINELKNNLNRLINLDFLNKTGESQTKTELSLFILEL